MSDHQTSVSEKNSASLTQERNHVHQDEPENSIVFICRWLLDQGDGLIYAIVGICFFLGALFTLGYSFWDFGSTLVSVPATVADAAAKHMDLTAPSVVAKAIIQFVSDLLLVLIIMEVLGTVTHYLKAHATSLRPFLFIGIVSATRSILSIGARLSVGQVQDFNNAMIELGVSGAVILALGIPLKLLGKLVETQE